MARIVFGSCMVRYPLGGMLSWALQWLVGFQRLGHDVYFVEKAGFSDSCFDPQKNVMSNDCAFGVATIGRLLSRFGLKDKFCYVDYSGRYYGMSRRQIEAVFRSADLFVDMGTHGAWLSEASRTQVRILVDGEPGYHQIKMEKALAAGQPIPQYDFYYTNGANIGTERSIAPTAGKPWGHVTNLVVTDMFTCVSVEPDAPFTTVMNWQSHEAIEHKDTTYGQKDMEFDKFTELPSLTRCPIEIAVAGKRIPKDSLEKLGWRIRDAHVVTKSIGTYTDYIAASRGEFSVCKNVFVAMNTGWFSDRSAAYLASGRPVVLQETGFGEHLPTGLGLFAVRTSEQAAAAIETIISDYDRHSQAAREIAREFLDSEKVLAGLLREIGC